MSFIITEKRYSQEIEKVKALENENAKLILDFDKRYPSKTINKVVSFDRRCKWLQVLRKCNDYLNGAPLNKLKEKDLETIVGSIHGHNGKVSSQTYNSYFNVLKVWIRWTQGEDSPLLKSRYIKRIRRDREQDIDPDMLPTEEETLAIIKAAENNNDFEMAAFVALIAGSGARPSSLFEMLKENVHWLDDGAINLNLKTKTGRHQIKVHAGYACFVKKWFECRKEDAAPLFASSYEAMIHRRKNLKHRLKIRKPLRWYDWRRAHAIWCFQNISPAAARKRLWNNVDSRMDAIYHKVSDKSVAEEYDRAMGNEPIKKESKFKPITCWKCRKELPPATDVCPTCNVAPDAQKYFTQQETDLQERLKQEIKQWLVAELEKRKGKN